MSIPRTILPALITLLLYGTGVVGAQSPAPASAVGDDRGRCASGEIDACVRVETVGCDAGEAKACRSLAGRFINSIGVPLDRVRAGQLMTRTFRLADSACTAGDLGGCAIAGVGYGSGQGAPLDVVRAHVLEERACAGGDAEGCYAVGFASLVGMLGFERDTVRAVTLLESTCAGGHSAACFSLGLNYEDGRTVARDHARAALFFHQACDDAVTREDMLACHFLGSAYSEGRGVPTDPVRAAQLYDRACQHGNGNGCNNLGQLFQEGRVNDGKDPAHAAPLYDRACQLGHRVACEYR
jgi:TPR repeat protein